jgi:hypothetical protein
MSQNEEFIGINGPTFDDVPVFVWSKTSFSEKIDHYGHSDRFEFEPFHFKWIL